MARRADIDRLFQRYGLTNRKVAAALGVSHQAVTHWRAGRNLINPVLARRLNQLFDVPLHLIRPDVWDAPASTKATPRRKAA
jgi:transcriptional regulator with XRE-family HTH domain